MLVNLGCSKQSNISCLRSSLMYFLYLLMLFQISWCRWYRVFLSTYLSSSLLLLLDLSEVCLELCLHSLMLKYTTIIVLRDCTYVP